MRNLKLKAAIITAGMLILLTAVAYILNFITDNVSPETMHHLVNNFFLGLVIFYLYKLVLFTLETEKPTEK
jgi:uncharacterized membrane protein (DUF373 family)